LRSNPAAAAIFMTLTVFLLSSSFMNMKESIREMSPAFVERIPGCPLSNIWREPSSLPSSARRICALRTRLGTCAGREGDLDTRLLRLGLPERLLDVLLFLLPDMYLFVLLEDGNIYSFFLI